GFLVNRVIFPYLLEAAEFFENGVKAQEIDEALLEWGMPMGPLRLIDEIGVDIAVDIANTLEKAYGKRDRAPKILREMQSAKMLGRKSGGRFAGGCRLRNDSWHRFSGLAWRAIALRGELWHKKTGRRNGETCAN